MPATPGTSQYLAPPIQGEQVPDTQIQAQGPFSAQLAAPQVRQDIPHPGGFTTGPGAALLTFANNFLEGASRGRLRAYQQSEQAKREHERNFDATVQHIQDNPNLTRDFKEQIMQQALATKAGAAQQVLGKGGKNDHPLSALARGIFTNIVGPAGNPNHVDIGPEHVSDLISKMHDPKNQFNLADSLAGAQTQLGSTIQSVQKAAADKGVPLYREDLMNHQDIVKALTPLRRQGYEPMNMPEISGAFSAVPPRPTAAQVAAQKTQEARLARESRMANAPIGLVAPSGEEFAAERREGKYYYPGTATQIPEEKLIGAKLSKDQASFTMGERLVQDTDENGAPVITSQPYVIQKGKGTPPPRGTQAAPGTPLPVAPTAAATPLPISGNVQIPEVAPGQPGRQQLASLNNNPGNLEFRNQPGAVLGDDGRFAKFQSPEAGFNALISNIQANETASLAEYIKKFAPPGGADRNDTIGYITNAAAALGVPPETPLSKIDPVKLAQFQAKQESGTSIIGGKARDASPATPAPTVHRSASGAPIVGHPKLAASSATGIASVMTPDMLAATKASSATGQRNEAFLNAVPTPQAKAWIKGMADYELTPPTGYAATKPEAVAAMANVKLYDPTYDVKEFPSRSKLRQSFTGGPDSKNMMSLDTLSGHLGTLYDMAQGLQASDVPKFNAAKLYFQKEFGNPNLTSFDLAKAAVATELSTALKGQAAQKDIDTWRDAISASGSPAQLEAAVKVPLSLMHTRLGELQEKYKKGMGGKTFPVLTPNSRSVFQKFGFNTEDIDPTGPTAPPPGAVAPLQANQKLSQADVGKTFLHPTKGRVKITAVNPQDPTKYLSEAVQ